MRCIFLSLLIILILVGSAGAEPVVKLDEYSVNIGETVDLPIIIKDSSNVAGGSIKIKFDSSIVKVVSVKEGDFGEPVYSIQNDQGFVKIAVAEAYAVKKSEAKLAIVEFKAINAGKTTLEIQEVSLNDENGNLLSADTVDGSLNVGSLIKPTPTETTTPEKNHFRSAPIVKIRPANKIVKKDQPTLLEFYFSNPPVNDVTLTVDVYISVPSGVQISAQGFSYDSGAGVLHGIFKIRPGDSRTIDAEVISAEPGDYYIKAQVIYYPNDDKNSYRQISLTHPFKVEPFKVETSISESNESSKDDNKNKQEPGFEAVFAILSTILSVILFRKINH
jgi:hypothetical protein